MLVAVLHSLYREKNKMQLVLSLYSHFVGCVQIKRLFLSLLLLLVRTKAEASETKVEALKLVHCGPCLIQKPAMKHHKCYFSNLSCGMINSI